MKKAFFQILPLTSLLLLQAGNPLMAQDSLQDCAGLEGDAERLACFDQVMKDGEDKGAQVIPAFRTPRARSDREYGPARVPPGQLPKQVEDNFGLELKSADKRGADQRQFRVVSASHNRFTGWAIEFENGQRWKQVGTDDFRIKEGALYTVTRASFNSFFLSSPENNRRIRISRLE